ncbi:hypothetical protein ACFPC0_17250 [Streptomyces andamanensis]|uniref:Uncharacterized protein n=1 Tax=Streptomyces andamanensis TaxID=1565035 RepID=A0ABV8TFP8_9ACTN
MCGLRTSAEVIDHLGAGRAAGIIEGTEIRDRRPAAGRKDRDRFICGKNKQNADKTMVVTNGGAQARQSGLVKLLAAGPAVEILADTGCQGPDAQTGGRVIMPPHRKFMKNSREWHEDTHERQCEAHSSRRIPVEHGIDPEELTGTYPSPRPS